MFMVMCPSGVIWATGILRRPELSNRRANSLQIKFIGTVLACRCERTLSFAHQDAMGVLTVIERTLELSAMIIHHQGHMVAPMGVRIYPRT